MSRYKWISLLLGLMLITSCYQRPKSISPFLKDTKDDNLVMSVAFSDPYILNRYMENLRIRIGYEGVKNIITEVKKSIIDTNLNMVLKLHSWSNYPDYRKAIVSVFGQDNFEYAFPFQDETGSAPKRFENAINYCAYGLKLVSKNSNERFITLLMDSLLQLREIKINDTNYLDSIVQHKWASNRCLKDSVINEINEIKLELTKKSGFVRYFECYVGRYSFWRIKITHDKYRPFLAKVVNQYAYFHINW